MEKTIKTLITTNILALITIIVMLMLWQPFKAPEVKAQTVTETVISTQTVKKPKIVKKAIKSKGFSFEVSSLVNLYSQKFLKINKYTRVRR